MNRHIMPLAILTFPVLAACTDPVVSPEAPPPVTTSLEVVPHESQQPRGTFDDEMEALARDAPGFAGFYLNENGELVIRVVEGHAPPSLVRLEATLGRTVYPGPALGPHRERLLSRTRVEPAQYDFLRLRTWYRSVASHVLAIEGVTKGDVDEVRNRIVFGVRDEAAADRVEAALASFPGPADAVLIEPFPPVIVENSLRSAVSPRIGGIEIGAPGQCTLGVNMAHYLGLQQGLPTFDEDWYFVTNSHCTSQFGTVYGDSATQPHSGSVIAVEYLDPDLFDSSVDSDCPSGHFCRYSDAALFRYLPSVSFAFATVAWPNLGSYAFNGSRTIVGGGDPVVNFDVHKVGRTTGRTMGKVVEVCGDYPQFSPGGIFTGRTMLCQALADYGSDGGDSGSPVMDVDHNGDLVHRGIHWGTAFDGTSTLRRAFSTSNRILSEFNPHLTGTMGQTIESAPPPEGSIVGPDSVPEGAHCEWSAAVVHGTPPFTYVWSGVLTGSGTPLVGSLENDGWLYLTVTDDRGLEATASLFITVTPVHPPPLVCP